MNAEVGRDLAAWIDLSAAVAANLTVAAGGLYALWRGLPRLKRIADASIARARAETRLAETHEAALVLNSTSTRVGEDETPISAARRLRARIIFDSYLEWRDAAHYANGGVFDAAEAPRYLGWLRQALQRLEVVLTEGARGGLGQYWEDRVREELKPHRHGLDKINPDEFDLGPLRELIRGK